MSRRLSVVATISIVLCAGGVHAAEAPGPDAVFAVRSGLEVERALLEEDTQRYSALAGARTRALSQLTDLYRSLDAAIRVPQDSETVQRLLGQIEQAEAVRARLMVAERSLVERIADRKRKLELLEDQLASLEAQAEDSGGLLSGSWDVSLLPLNQKGQFSIAQTGTLISGTYALDGGWTGSLQGTLVNRKVFLVRIDSKLGRSMELEGYLAGDGKTIRGTWLNYELAGQEGSTGQWSAVRRR